MDTSSLGTKLRIGLPQSATAEPKPINFIYAFTAIDVICRQSMIGVTAT
jgi:hypothetical protein